MVSDPGLLMRRKPAEKRIERQIIINMITRDGFLQEVIPIFRRGIFSLPYANILAGWCIEYFTQYDKAPGKDIEELFRNHKDDGHDEDQIELIKQFLLNLSEEYEGQPEKFNIKYHVDQAEKYLRLQALEKHKEEVSKALMMGDPEQGELAITEYTRPSRPEAQGIDPINDTDEIKRAIDPDLSAGEILFQPPPGALRFLLGSFDRDTFAMIVGAMGSGKTWWLIQLTVWALRAGCNVLFVSLEMNKVRMLRRIMHCLTALPKKKWAGEILLPVFDCYKNQIGQCQKGQRTNDIPLREENEKLPDFDDAPKGYQPCTYCRRSIKVFQPAVWYRLLDKDEIDVKSAMRAARKFRRIARGSRLKMINPPPDSMTVKQLGGMLDNWEHYEGWIPDVVITDYADKFAPETNRYREYRHRIYETIIAHKSLSSRRNIAVISASQSNTSRDENKRIQSGDFGEDIRKKAEVDKAFSINQRPKEKEQGVTMFWNMKERDDFTSNYPCMVLGQLKIGRPYLDSCMMPGGGYVYRV